MTERANGRRNIPAPIEAALWALSNGRCYAPGCPFPVIVEVRPGVPRKNAQIAHIHGVQPNAPRYRPGMSAAERDSFRNLLLLCLPHHAEVDDKKTGAAQYPPELLRQWKTKHEGSLGPALARIGTVDPNVLVDTLTDLFAPPVERLEMIADQLERTGTLNADTVNDLRQIVDVMADSPTGPDARTAGMLMEAAVLLRGLDLGRTVNRLMEGAEMLRYGNR